MQEFRGLTPLLGVYDMPASVRFYRDILGFSIVSSSPHRGGDPDRFHWVWLRNGTAGVMLNTNYEFDEERPEKPSPEKLAGREGGVCLYIGCPDVDAAYAELLARGVAPDGPPKTAPYGMKQLYLRDPDGYLLCLQWQA